MTTPLVSNHLPPLARNRRRPHHSHPRPVDMIREADVLRVDFPKDNPDPSLAMRFRVLAISYPKNANPIVYVESLISGAKSQIDREYLYHLMRSHSVRRETPMELMES